MLARLHRLALRTYSHLPRPARRWVVRRVTPQFTLGAMCLIERDDGRVLLVRQSYRQRWGLPGGLLARREEPAETAVREIGEEVGLHVELVGEPAVVVEPGPRRVDLVFRARPVDRRGDGARPTSPEILEVAWFDPAALPELQDESAQAMRAISRAEGHPAARRAAP